MSTTDHRADLRKLLDSRWYGTVKAEGVYDLTFGLEDLAFLRQVLTHPGARELRDLSLRTNGNPPPQLMDLLIACGPYPELTRLRLPGDLLASEAAALRAVTPALKTLLVPGFMEGRLDGVACQSGDRWADVPVAPQPKYEGLASSVDALSRSSWWPTLEELVLQYATDATCRVLHAKPPPRLRTLVLSGRVRDEGAELLFEVFPKLELLDLSGNELSPWALAKAPRRAKVGKQSWSPKEPVPEGYLEDFSRFLSGQVPALRAIWLARLVEGLAAHLRAHGGEAQAATLDGAVGRGPMDKAAWKALESTLNKARKKAHPTSDVLLLASVQTCAMLRGLISYPTSPANYVRPIGVLLPWIAGCLAHTDGTRADALRWDAAEAERVRQEFDPQPS